MINEGDFYFLSRLRRIGERVQMSAEGVVWGIESLIRGLNDCVKKF